ncbi:MFS transporter [Azospirillum sp. A39]|uniref:MFS transporter n=1 Tax=Azospirillum sp. A39 TaxID=3462279 RepID=UPI004045B66C
MTPEGRLLLLLCVSRFGTCIAHMVFAGSLPFLLAAWSMTGAQAGTIQAAYNFAYAVSLLAASWLADRVGAKRVFLVSTWASAATFVAFAAGARSYESTLVLFALVALSQGGTYTPTLMLVAQEVAPERRGRAIGWTLAAASFGYLVSILVSVGGASLASYEWGFAAAAVGPVVGALAGWRALSGTANVVHRRPGVPGARAALWRALRSRSSLLLTVGYTAHCWELLGMWAWTPAFLTAALGGGGGFDPLALSLSIAVSIHLAGVLATLSMGEASDRWGRRSVLLWVALLGALLSATFGWAFHLPAAALLTLAFVYSFAVLGDSGVLSAAMTEAVAPQHLGTLFALRSLLGFGAGAVSPVVFGAVLDATGHGGGWGWAFLVLGAGGAVATACALLLPAVRAERGSAAE